MLQSARRVAARDVKLPSYLQRKRFGIYYFRRAVPEALRPTVGKLEIIRSLRTRELRRAIWHGRALALQVESWFQAVETQMARKHATRSKPRLLRIDLVVTIEEIPERPRRAIATVASIMTETRIVLAAG